QVSDFRRALATAMQRPCQIAKPPPRPAPASPLPGTLANNCGRGEERLGNSGTGMLRIAATALLCAAFILCAALLHSTGSKPPSTAHASAAEPHTVEITYGRVQAVAKRDRFDPFGEIVPLPVFRLEQFRRPAFDPALYRGGRVGEPLKHDDLCDVLEDI